MLKLRDGIVELYKKVATSLPSDVEEALKYAYSSETDEEAKESLETILKKIPLSRKNAVPLCEDTGFPVFFVKVPIGISYQMIRDVLAEATRIATSKIPLTPNAVDIITGANTGDNVGIYYPLLYIEETLESTFTVDLMLRCADCENMGTTYKLPLLFDTKEGNVLAERNFDGVKKCVIDSILINNKDKKCAPYSLGIAIGGMRDQVTFLSKRQLLRRITSKHPNEKVAIFEKEMLDDINNLMTISGRKIKALSVKLDTAHRHPGTFFVDISYACWAYRKARLMW